MGDVFKEQLVKRVPTHKDTLIKAGLIGACFFIVFASLMFIPQFLPIIAIVLGFGLFYTFSMMRKEYEYIFTNGELDIDCIYGKSRRKRKFSCEVREAFIIAHHSRRDAEQELSTATATMDFSTGVINDTTFYLLAIHQGKRVKVVFNPNEMMFNAVKSYISPRKLLKKQ